MRSLLTTALTFLWLSGCTQWTPSASNIDAPVQSQPTAQAIAQPRVEKATPITWDDLILPHDDRFDPGDLPLSAEKVKDRRVRITGVMYGGVPRTKGNTEFIVMRNSKGRHGPRHPVDELIKVTMTSGRVVSYVDEWIQVEGILRVEPVIGEDRYVWCVYHLDNARVSQSGTIIDEPAITPTPLAP